VDGHTLDDTEVTEAVALGHAAAGSHQAAGADLGSVADDRVRLDHRTCADPATVDHEPRSDRDVITEDQICLAHSGKSVMRTSWP